MRHFYCLRTVNTRTDLCLRITTTIKSTYIMDLRLKIIPVLSNKAFGTHLDLGDLFIQCDNIRFSFNLSKPAGSAFLNKKKSKC